MRLRYAPRARADIAQIHAYIAEHNPKAATKVVRRIRETAGSLAKQPGLGRSSDIAGVRLFAVTPYPHVIYYAVASREVVILHIRHGARAAPTAADLS
jgi:plasmid stabilization system protein ParE